jgi:hypothetical protein
MHHEARPAMMTPPGWLQLLWLWWMLTSLLGSTFGGLAILHLTSNGPTWQSLPELALLWLLGGGIAGLISGGFQAGFLRRCLPRPWCWVLVTTLSSSIAWMLAHITARGLAQFLPGKLRGMPGIPWNSVLYLTLAIGMPVIAILLTGGIQWLWLRRQVRQSGLWLRRTLLSASVSWPVALILSHITEQAPVWPILQEIHGSLGWWIGLFVSGAVVAGIIGGHTMAEMLRFARSQLQSPVPDSAQHHTTQSLASHISSS